MIDERPLTTVINPIVDRPSSIVLSQADDSQKTIDDKAHNKH